MRSHDVPHRVLHPPGGARPRRRAARLRVAVTVYACPPEKERVQRYRDAGIDRVVFGVPPPGTDVVLGALDRLAELAGAVG